MTKPNLEEFKAALRLAVPGVVFHAYSDRAANADTPSANMLFTGAAGPMLGVYVNTSLDAARAVFDAYGIGRDIIQESVRHAPYVFISLSCFAED